MSAAPDPVREAAVLVRLPDRGIVEVHGGDRARWLEGQLSHEVSSLDPHGPNSGRHALLLTPQGRIVADVYVIARPDHYWLELHREAVAPALERLDRYLVADDVELLDRSESVARLALEGPRAPEVLAAAAAEEAAQPAPGAAREITIAGVPVVVAAWTWSGEPGVQLFVPSRERDSVVRALLEAGAARGLVRAEPERLEAARVEAGVPRYGAEIGPDVLPADVGLDERAVSFTKGCYVGQEIVARMRSHGRAKRALVGLRAADDTLLPVGEPVEHEGRRVGRVTSAARSLHAGAIALGLVERPLHRPGTALHVAGRAVRVAALPFVKPAGSAGSPARGA